MSRIRNPLHLEIVPSPGTQIQDWATMKQKLEVLNPFIESVHIDLLDGKFVNNANFMDPKPFAEFASSMILEAHFMTENPMQYIKSFADAGFKRFIGQVEKMPDIAAFVAEAQLYGEVGLAVDVPTSVDTLFPYLEDIDIAFVMTVKAGFSNQAFLPEMLEKVGELRKKDEFIAIEVDGGVNDMTISVLKDAGATRFVSTGFIFNGNPEQQFEKLTALLHS